MDELRGRIEARESGDTQRTEQLRRRITALWVAVVALAIVLSGATAYGYLALEKLNLKVSDLPGVQQTLALAGSRLDGVEAKLNAWAADWDVLQARLTKMDKKIAYNRELARAEGQKQAEAVRAELRAEMEEQGKAVDARLGLLESSQEAERARLAQLQEDIESARVEGRRELASLREDFVRGDQRLEELARVIDRERVDFELDEGRTREIAGGVSLRITGTNVGHQKVKGWLWLLPDRKTLWIRDLGIQQAMVFYRKDGGGPNELVITSVQDGSVSGYLLLPAAAGQRLDLTGQAPAATGSGAAAADTGH